MLQIKCLDALGKDVCNAIETASKGKLKCEDFALVYKETIDKILERVAEEDFDKICNLLSKNENNQVFIKTLLKDNNINDEIRKSLIEKLNLKDSSPDFIEEVLNKISNIIGFSIENGIETNIFFR